MPGFDRTGPRGQGPMSGRGMGPCGGGMARGAGYGRGFGRGGGFGRRFGFQAGYGPDAGYAGYPRTMGPEDEGQVLETQARRLRADLEAVEARMAALKNPES